VKWLAGSPLGSTGALVMCSARVFLADGDTYNMCVFLCVAPRCVRCTLGVALNVVSPFMRNCDVDICPGVMCCGAPHVEYIFTVLLLPTCVAPTHLVPCVGLSWSDVLLGPLPNVYLYAANNPSESIVAKRRGYGTIVSHNVPPYGRAGGCRGGSPGGGALQRRGGGLLAQGSGPLARLRHHCEPQRTTIRQGRWVTTGEQEGEMRAEAFEVFRGSASAQRNSQATWLRGCGTRHGRRFGQQYCPVGWDLCVNRELLTLSC
jgi:hypothetical protein